MTTSSANAKIRTVASSTRKPTSGEILLRAWSRIRLKSNGESGPLCFTSRRMVTGTPSHSLTSSTVEAFPYKDRTYSTNGAGSPDLSQAATMARCFYTSSSFDPMTRQYPAQTDYLPDHARPRRRFSETCEQVGNASHSGGDNLVEVPYYYRPDGNKPVVRVCSRIIRLRDKD